MPRFFISPTQLTPEGTAVITEDDAHHIARSLRMAVGDEITVCDGSGMVYTCRLDSIHDDRVDAAVLSAEMSRSEPPYALTLFMAYPKGDKLETVIQKAVELGASRIVPFDSERCIKRPSAEKQPRITERLNRIAYEAAKQCGRAFIPTVESPVTFSEMTTRAAEAELSLFCYEGEHTVSLISALTDIPPATIAVIVGCEGGFSPAEAERICACGIPSVSLGPRILRCETAPDYVLAALSCKWELKNA